MTAISSASRCTRHSRRLPRSSAGRHEARIAASSFSCCSPCGRRRPSPATARLHDLSAHCAAALALIETMAAPRAGSTAAGDDPGVLRAAANLRADLAASAAARRRDRASSPARSAAMPLIDRLIREHRLDASGVAGRWEASCLAGRRSVRRRASPAPDHRRGRPRAARSSASTTCRGRSESRRGPGGPTSRRAAPPRCSCTAGPPTDRAAPSNIAASSSTTRIRPSPAGRERPFGGVNHRFYEHVFDLILRLRGNFLWPAMWGKSFHEDDPENAAAGQCDGNHRRHLASRAVDARPCRWEHHGQGPWDYATKASGCAPSGARAGAHARRGTARHDRHARRRRQADGARHGDRIARTDRRRPAQDHRGGDPSPRRRHSAGLGALQGGAGLLRRRHAGARRRHPALLRRQLGQSAPPAGAGTHRAGGSGIYYHFDYVGGPRNYKWIDTNQIERVWQQMRLADEYGADRLWIVNVGDIKPMEYPTSFFLDMAWNPKAMTLARMDAYPRDWAATQFGPEHAAEIGESCTRYGELIARRKPELLDADTYSLDGFEWDRVVGSGARCATSRRSLRRSCPRRSATPISSSSSIACWRRRISIGSIGRLRKSPLCARQGSDDQHLGRPRRGRLHPRRGAPPPLRGRHGRWQMDADDGADPYRLYGLAAAGPGRHAARPSRRPRPKRTSSLSWMPSVSRRMSATLAGDSQSRPLRRLGRLLPGHGARPATGRRGRASTIGSGSTRQATWRCRSSSRRPSISADREGCATPFVRWRAAADRQRQRPCHRRRLEPRRDREFAGSAPPATRSLRATTSSISGRSIQASSFSASQSAPDPRQEARYRGTVTALSRHRSGQEGMLGGYRRFALVCCVAAVSAAAVAVPHLAVNERGYLSGPGLDVIVFSDIYPEGHQTGVTAIQQRPPRRRQWRSAPRSLARPMVAGAARGSGARRRGGSWDKGRTGERAPQSLRGSSQATGAIWWDSSRDCFVGLAPSSQ